MRFSKQGAKVTVVDNYFRRTASKDLDAGILYELPSLVERARIWHEHTGKEIKVIIADLADPENMRRLFLEDIHYDWEVDSKPNGLPDTVIHYAEQPSAPYSMKDYRTADTTLINNLRVTNNLIWAVRDYSRETHIIKLGTMGEYGTPNIDIEEGWIDIEHKGRKQKFLYPRQAGSLYHTSKIMDTDLLWFAVRMWDLKVTDLMQGPVYGIETEESEIDLRLRTLFNYDEIFGTIVNRFIVQAVTGHPLTVYGAGGQTRGYLNIRDTLQCVGMAEKKPAEKGELRIFNQIMETFSVNQLAALTRKIAYERGYDVEISNLPNPRVEAEDHYYNPVYQGLKDIGVEPHYLTDEVMHGLFEIVEQYKDKINRDIIFKGIKWG